MRLKFWFAFDKVVNLLCNDLSGPHLEGPLKGATRLEKKCRLWRITEVVGR